MASVSRTTVVTCANAEEWAAFLAYMATQPVVGTVTQKPSNRTYTLEVNDGTWTVSVTGMTRVS